MIETGAVDQIVARADRVEIAAIGAEARPNLVAIAVINAPAGGPEIVRALRVRVVSGAPMGRVGGRKVVVNSTGRDAIPKRRANRQHRACAWNFSRLPTAWQALPSRSKRAGRPIRCSAQRAFFSRSPSGIASVSLRSIRRARFSKWRTARFPSIARAWNVTRSGT